MSLTAYLLRCKRENAVLLAWLMVNSLCVLGNGLLSAQALTSLVAKDIPAFLTSISLNLAVYLVWIVQIKQIEPARERALQAMNHEIRTDVLTRLSQTSYLQFHKETADTYTSWLTNDITTINDLGFECLELMLTQALNVIFAAVTLIGYHPSFAASVLLLTILMSSLPKLFEERLANQALLFSQKNETLLSAINHSLKGYPVLFGVGQLKELVGRVTQPEKDYAISRISYQETFGSLMATQNGASFISQLTILAQAGLLFSLGLVPIGAVSSSPYFASVVFASLTGFFANWSEVKSTKPIFDKFNHIPRTHQSSTSEFPLNQPLSTHQLTLTLSDQVTLSFPDLHLEKGQIYRLTGPSGVGKSSLLHLLSGRLVADSGAITLGGQGLSDQELPNLVSLVPQDGFIFEDSLRYNLTLGRELADQQLLKGVSDLALTDVLNQLPEGLDSPICQENLSGGQIQRICLLRALLEDKPFLLLDEATAALDSETAKQVEAFIFSQTDKSILFVSHQEPAVPTNWTRIALH